MFRILVHADVREEMLERSDVMAAFDTQERQEKLRDMLAQWRGYAGLTRASLDLRTGLWRKTSANFTVLKFPGQSAPGRGVAD